MSSFALFKAHQWFLDHIFGFRCSKSWIDWNRSKLGIQLQFGTPMTSMSERLVQKFNPSRLQPLARVIRDPTFNISFHIIILSKRDDSR